MRGKNKMDADFDIECYYELRMKGMHDRLSLREYLEKHGSSETRRNIRVYDEFKMQGIHDGKTLTEHLRKKIK